jgi:hypothetical protein
VYDRRLLGIDSINEEAGHPRSMNANDPYNDAVLIPEPRAHVRVDKANLGRAPRKPSQVEKFHTSITCVAYIPKNALPAFFNVFEDDKCDQQPIWLSQTYYQNSFRMVHGLELVWSASSSGDDAEVHEFRVLGRSNPTQFRGLPYKMPSNPEYANHPGWMLPPPPNTAAFTVALGHSTRSMNGFLETDVGKFMTALRSKTRRAFKAKDPDELPRIGSSLNLWTTPEGCRAIVTMHNTFPKYAYYIDGRQIPWDGEPEKSFQQFDGYDIEVEWRREIVLALNSAITSYPPEYPIELRYPAGCTFGWWRGVSEDGVLIWCGNRTPLTSIDFEPSLESLNIASLWDALQYYVQIIREGPDRPEYSSDERRMLELVWDRLEPRSWKVRRFLV